jgi:hypothetical protein
MNANAELFYRLRQPELTNAQLYRRLRKGLIRRLIDKLKI